MERERERESNMRVRGEKKREREREREKRGGRKEESMNSRIGLEPLCTEATEGLARARVEKNQEKMSVRRGRRTGMKGNKRILYDTQGTGALFYWPRKDQLDACSLLVSCKY